MQARILFVAAALSVLGVEATASAADKCFPSCRAGFVCSPQGTCVSECNPPCAGNEVCSGGVCKGSNAPAGSSETPRHNATPPAAAPAAPAAASSAAASDSPTVTEPRLAALMGGFAILFGSGTAFGFTGTMQFKTSGDHAFIAGPRLGVFFPSGYTFGAAGVDLGYRGNFVKNGTLEAGALVMFQPNVAFGVPVVTPLSFPVVAGGFLHYGAFEGQAVIGGGPTIGISSFATATTGFGTFQLIGGYAF